MSNLPQKSTDKETFIDQDEVEKSQSVKFDDDIKDILKITKTFSDINDKQTAKYLDEDTQSSKIEQYVKRVLSEEYENQSMESKDVEVRKVYKSVKRNKKKQNLTSSQEEIKKLLSESSNVPDTSNKKKKKRKKKKKKIAENSTLFPIQVEIMKTTSDISNDSENLEISVAFDNEEGNPENIITAFSTPEKKSKSLEEPSIEIEFTYPLSEMTDMKSDELTKNNKNQETNTKLFNDDRDIINIFYINANKDNETKEIPYMLLQKTREDILPMLKNCRDVKIEKEKCRELRLTNDEQLVLTDCPNTKCNGFTVSCASLTDGCCECIAWEHGDHKLYDSFLVKEYV